MNIENLSPQALKKAAEFLREGKLVAFPTETVYGLGADATNDKAVAEIFAIKGRPQFNPLIVHVDGVEMAQRFVCWNERAEKLAAAFWPGPLTLVLPRLSDSPISLLVSAGGDTIGLRMPANNEACNLITTANIPLAAPSANRSGRVSPTTAQHVYEEFKNDLSLILDGGECAVGIESTVVDISGDVPILWRPGFIMKEQLEKTLGCKVVMPGGAEGALKSPGLLLSHYAPTLPIRLNAMELRANEALLAFGKAIPQGAKHMINLSEAGDLKQAAARLFAALRMLDKPEYSAIAVMPIPESGLGIAINDRLQRAAQR